MKESSWEIRREQREGGKGTNKILVGTKTSQLFHSAAGMGAATSSDGKRDLVQMTYALGGGRGPIEGFDTDQRGEGTNSPDF